MADPKDFTEFWQLYPRRVAKLAAQKAWAKIPQEELDAVFQGLQNYIAYEWQGKEVCFIPHASTWLNGRRWEDEILPQVKPHWLTVGKGPEARRMN